MKAEQFIKSKGNITDPNIRFLNAGAVTNIPLAQLLDEYAALQDKPVIAPVKKLKKK
jgi:hypothetical protein